MLPQEICWILDRAFACEVIRHPPSHYVPTFIMYPMLVASDGMAHRLQSDTNSVYTALCSLLGRPQPGLPWTSLPDVP